MCVCVFFVVFYYKTGGKLEMLAFFCPRIEVMAVILLRALWKNPQRARYEILLGHAQDTEIWKVENHP